MRPALLMLPLLTACAAMPNDPGGLSAWPGALFGAGADTAQSGAVELVVKTHHTALLTEIAAGGGPTLTRAMDTAGIPLPDRPARLIQLNADLGLYAANPGALVTALTVYGR